MGFISLTGCDALLGVCPSWGENLLSARWTKSEETLDRHAHASQVAACTEVVAELGCAGAGIRRRASVASVQPHVVGSRRASSIAQDDGETVAAGH